MQLDLVLRRKTINKLNGETTKKKLKVIVGAAKQFPEHGFLGGIGRIIGPKVQEDGYLYQTTIRVKKEGRVQPQVDQPRLEKILMEMSKRAIAQGWQIVEQVGGLSTSHNHLEDDDEEAPSMERVYPPKKKFVLPELTKDIYKHQFAGCYERDAHIRTIHSALKTCVESDGEILSHVLLHGMPGACKTKLMEKFKLWLEEDGERDRVLFVDGTTMTKAGLENWLLELAEAKRLPEILVVDELEKQPMDNLLCLNGVMGSGVLAKLNAKRSNERHPAKFVVVGLCNDKDAIKEFRNGAIWSRFTHKLHCVRPSRELCLRILRELTITMPSGKVIWADKAMEFGWDELGQRDIRQIKGHIDGRDRLLNGSWQDDQRMIIKLGKQEEEIVKQENQSD